MSFISANTKMMKFIKNATIIRNKEDLLKVEDGSEIIYLNNNGEFTMTTMELCEHCGTPCEINSVTIQGGEIDFQMAGAEVICLDEISYSEELEGAVCEKCYQDNLTN